MSRSRQTRMLDHLQKKRRRQHDQVMKEENLPDLGLFREHEGISIEKAEWIDTPEGLADILAHLRERGSFAFDTEFISELTYHSRICLVQVATEERLALLDPLQGLDLKPFWELVADPSLEKIVHAGQQDLEPVLRLLDREPANIFDTQIAAGMCGLPWPLALNKLISALLDFEISKGPAFTDWSQRPLDPVQYYYASNDVRFLPALRAELGRRLTELGRAGWLQSECDAQCRREALSPDEEQIVMRVKGAGTLRQRAWVVLWHTALFRDRLARRADLPPRSLLRDETLIDLARRTPADRQALEQASLPRSFLKEHGEAFWRCLQEAAADTVTSKPDGGRLEEKARERQQVDNLLALAQCWCLGRRVSPALAYTRQQLLRFLRYRKRRPEEVDLLQGWRREFLGAPLGELMEGRLSGRVSWSRGRLQLDVDGEQSPAGKESP